MSLEFEVRVEEARTTLAVIAAAGEIDVFTAPGLRDAAHAAVDAGATDVVFDLTRTTFIDSSGLGVIVGLKKRIGEGGSVSIVNVDANIARTLAITGLDASLPVWPTREAAVAALSS